MVGRGGNDVSIGIGDVEDSGAFITKNKNNGGSTMPCVALYCHLPKGQGILRHIALLFIRGESCRPSVDELFFLCLSVVS